MQRGRNPLASSLSEGRIVFNFSPLSFEASQADGSWRVDQIVWSKRLRSNAISLASLALSPRLSSSHRQRFEQQFEKSEQQGEDTRNAMSKRERSEEEVVESKDVKVPKVEEDDFNEEEEDRDDFADVK